MVRLAENLSAQLGPRVLPVGLRVWETGGTQMERYDALHLVGLKKETP